MVECSKTESIIWLVLEGMPAIVVLFLTNRLNKTMSAVSKFVGSPFFGTIRFFQNIQVHTVTLKIIVSLSQH